VTVALDGGQWRASRRSGLRSEPSLVPPENNAVYSHTPRKRLAVSGTRDRYE